MHVAERRREQVARALHRVQPPCDLQGVLGRRVELRGGARPDAVLLASHDPGLDLEDQVALPEPFEQLHGDVEVLLERQRAAVEHVAVEQVRLARRPPPLGLLDERHHERVQLVRLAMVGVERHVDRISRRDAVHVFGNRDGAERHVLHAGARRERAAAGRYLDDPVAPAVGQSFQDGVGRGERRHVDGGIGELSLPRAIEHLAVPGMVGYRHTGLRATTMVTVLKNPIERYQY